MHWNGLLKPAVAAVLFAGIVSPGMGQTPRTPKYKAEVPESIKTPDVVETERLGTLRFFDGMPDRDTVRKVYDNLDFCRGVETFLNAIPASRSTPCGRG